MSETYRKRGATTRLEQRGTESAIVHTSEYGEATIADGVFRAATLPSSREPEFRDSSSVEACRRAIEKMIMPPVILERSTILEGTADHWWTDGEIERNWKEDNARAHVTVIHPEHRVRCAMSLGGPSLDTVDLEPLNAAIEALTRFDPASLPSRRLALALESAVTAELWPVLLEMLAAFPASPISEISALEVRQGTHPNLSFDGTGETIRARPLLAADGPASWPNLFRPSYRIRPVRAPFHLEGTSLPPVIDAPPSRAVAVLAPFSCAGNLLAATLLCSHENGTFAGRISWTIEEWLERLIGGTGDAVWFPVGAGSYGRRLVIDDVQLQGVS